MSVCLICLSVYRCRCLLEMCADQLVIMGEYLLDVLQVVDRPLALLFSSIEQLFDNIKQLFTHPFPTTDFDVDDSKSDTSPLPSSPPTQSLRPPTQSLGPPTESSRRARLAAGCSLDAEEALDLSVRHVHVQTSSSPSVIHYSHHPHVTATRAPSTASLWPHPHVTKTTATLAQSQLGENKHVAMRTLSSQMRESDSRLERRWSQTFCHERPPVRQHQLTSAQFRYEQPSLAPVIYEQRSVYEGVVAHQCHAQRSFHQLPVAPVSHEQPSTSTAQFRHEQPSLAHVNYEQRSVYEGVVAHQCHAQRSVHQLPLAPVNHEQPSTSTAQFRYEQPSLAPVIYEQRSVYEGAVAHQCDAQRSVAELAVAPVNHEQPSVCHSVVHAARQSSADDAEPVCPRGVVNAGNTCFVSCVLQCLAVMTELVAAVQLAATDSDSASLISSLSDVLSVLHKPCRQAMSPVHADVFIAVISRLMSTQSRSLRLIDIDNESQRQQDGAEFLACLFQLLRPRLDTGTHTGLHDNCFMLI